MGGQTGSMLIPFLCGAALFVVALLVRRGSLMANRRSKTKLGMSAVADTGVIPVIDSGVKPVPPDNDEPALPDNGEPKLPDNDEPAPSDVNENVAVADDAVAADDGGSMPDEPIPATDQSPSPTIHLPYIPSVKDNNDEAMPKPAPKPIKRRRLPETVKLKHKAVLVADDVASNRDLVSAYFEGTGVRLDFAENGEEACAKFEKNPTAYNLILMDVQMPVMDGYEAAGRIRAMDIGWAKQVPIMAMTANVSKEEIDACFDAGMDDHIAKPLDMQELLDRVFEVIAGAE